MRNAMFDDDMPHVAAVFIACTNEVLTFRIVQKAWSGILLRPTPQVSCIVHFWTFLKGSCDAQQHGMPLVVCAAGIPEGTACVSSHKDRIWTMRRNSVLCNKRPGKMTLLCLISARA